MTALCQSTNLGKFGTTEHPKKALWSLFIGNGRSLELPRALLSECINLSIQE